MEHFVRISDWFDASHQVAERERCSRQHGHRWTVTVTQASTRKLGPEEADALSAGLLSLLREWHDRDLNEMIPNFSEPTPERLAPWIMERLLAVSQLLASVEVSDGVISAKVMRDPSGLPSFVR